MVTARRFAKPAAVVGGVLLVVVGYNVLAGSTLFKLAKVEVHGAGDSLGHEVEQTVARAIGQASLIDTDLVTLRQKVEAISRVRTARVARVLPDKIRVTVGERQPLVPVRRKADSVVWLDAEGVELGEITSIKSGEKEIPPVAKGFAEDTRSPIDQAANRERITLYRQIQRELSEGRDPKWNLLDQIDLEYAPDVNLHLARPVVVVRVGSRDFRNRFETALKILDAVRRGDTEMLRRYRLDDPERLIENAGKINFIDVARPDRVVINFSTPGTERAKQAPK
jgi:cell division septal protein FtsQ